MLKRWLINVLQWAFWISAAIRIVQCSVYSFRNIAELEGLDLHIWEEKSSDRRSVWRCGTLQQECKTNKIKADGRRSSYKFWYTSFLFYRLKQLTWNSPHPFHWLARRCREGWWLLNFLFIDNRNACLIIWVKTNHAPRGGKWAFPITMFIFGWIFDYSIKYSYFAKEPRSCHWKDL